jgi:hypothetical protein
MTFLIEKFLSYRAKRLAAHTRAKAYNEEVKLNPDLPEKQFKITDPDLKITSKDSEVDFKTLVADLSK